MYINIKSTKSKMLVPDSSYSAPLFFPPPSLLGKQAQVNYPRVKSIYVSFASETMT